MSRTLLPAVALSTAMLALAPPAGAVTPGQNGRIAFASYRDGTPTTELYTVEADGTGLQRLTRTNWTTEQSPAWSPDGMRIAYESSADGRFRIHVMNANGSEPTRVSPEASDAVDDIDPAWSADGSQLVFASTRSGGWHLWVMNADGSGLRHLSEGFGVQPAWSPDGTRIAYAWSDAIYVVDASGGSARRLTNSGGASEGSPAWSPDGSQIAFMRYAGGLPGELFVIGADGANERQLTSAGFANASPAWSPDGSQLVFQRRVGDTWRLYVAAADGSAVRSLQDAPRDELQPDWGVYAEIPPPPPANDPGGPEIGIFSPEGGAFYPEGGEVSAAYFCWSETSPVISCEGSVQLGAPIDTAAPGEHMFTVTAEDFEGRRSTRSVTYTVIDVNPPVIDVRAPAEGAEYPMGADVAVDYSCSDGSGILHCEGSLPDGAPLDTSRAGAFTFEVIAVDAAGHHAIARTGYRVVDRTPPSVVLVSPGDASVYTLGENVVAEYSCADEPGGSGIAFCKGDLPLGSPLDTASPGTRTFAVAAADRAGNATSVAHSYSVVYRFEGFYPPLVPFPGFSDVKAGDTVPVKFSLHGDQGMDVLAAHSPAWRPVACAGSWAAPDSAAAQGSLSFNGSADRYLYHWRTDEAWAGACRELAVTLRDGTVHRARFRFGR